MTEARPVPPATADRPPARRRRAIGVLLSIAALALLLDFGTKQWAISGLTPGEPVRILGGLVHLSLTRNSGAAWSIGADYTWVFPIIAIGVVGWIVWMAAKVRSLPWAVSLGLVLGGALGNLNDRIFREPGPFVGHVVDMISVFGPYGQYFPIFNIADSALFCGVVLAVLLELTGRQRDGSRLPSRRHAASPPAASPPAGEPSAGEPPVSDREERA
ncbi:signal peptidase II [Plantactinospora sp. GCM10030261]|uniref:signal peptidase II n=1 Tax=Plantactinospora sp. GCM10030261 TaxID=3273420 RepID=UPI003606848E